MSGQSTRRVARTATIMGTVVSVHAIVNDGGLGNRTEERIEERIDGSFAALAEVEAVFSPFRPDSDVSRMRAGTLNEADADPRVREVHRACDLAESATGGRFSARWRTGFDPTGYVKGWAVEAAHEAWLLPLLQEPGVVAVGMNAGGDMQLSTRPGADWTWRVGIADPLAPDSVLATLELKDGAVATSGLMERGAHIVDPRTGRPATGAVSATVVAASLADADVWATAAVVAGVDDLGWVALAPHTSGIVVGVGGRARRWAGGAEIS